MSFGAPASEDQQPASFAFTAENLALAKRIIARYPAGKQQSAVMPLLDLAQRQNGNWLPRAAMDYVADLLEMPRIRVYEVASFYTMYNKAPVGKFLIWVCTTTPCWLCGSDDVKRAIKDKLGIAAGQTSADGLFTAVETECLGACVNAPMVQINDDYYEDLNYDRMCAVIDALKRGEAPPVGSQTGRHGSQPAGGPTTLLTPLPQREVKVETAAKPAETPAPGEAAKPAPTALPVEASKPVEAVMASEVGQPEIAKPADTVKAEPVKKVEAAKPAEKPAEPTKPVVAKPAGRSGGRKGAKTKE